MLQLTSIQGPKRGSFAKRSDQSRRNFKRAKTSKQQLTRWNSLQPRKLIDRRQKSWRIRRQLCAKRNSQHHFTMCKFSKVQRSGIEQLNFATATIETGASSRGKATKPKLTAISTCNKQHGRHTRRFLRQTFCSITEWNSAFTKHDSAM